MARAGLSSQQTVFSPGTVARIEMVKPFVLCTSKEQLLWGFSLGFGIKSAWRECQRQKISSPL
jgi:hypothetical protein